MIVILELSPEVEAGLAAQAKAHGMALPLYAARVLSEQVPARPVAALSPGERAIAWREAAQGLPRTPPLSDEAISRESLYSVRG